MYATKYITSTKFGAANTSLEAMMAKKRKAEKPSYGELEQAYDQVVKLEDERARQIGEIRQELTVAQANKEALEQQVLSWRSFTEALAVVSARKFLLDELAEELTNHIGERQPMLDGADIAEMLQTAYGNAIVHAWDRVQESRRQRG